MLLARRRSSGNSCPRTHASTSASAQGKKLSRVHRCVNDIVCCGAKPLFFLDYYATCALDVDVAEAVIKGIAAGCGQCGAQLMGGETAEMPGMYSPGEYDLAGFAVGAVMQDAVVTGENITPGDVMIGLPSSGVHSNGFSLVRKVRDSTNDI